MVYKARNPSDDNPNASISAADALIVCLDLGDGGVQRVISILSDHWSERGRQLCVVTLTETEEAYRLHPAVRRVRMNQESHKAQGSVASRLRRTKVIEYAGIYRFIVHQVRGLHRVINSTGCATVLAFSVCANVVAILACFGTGRRLIISERNDPGRQQLRHPWDGLRRFLYNQADVITANSYGALTTMEDYVDKRKLAFVPNPLFRSEINVPGARETLPPSILTVGRLCDQKGHDVLIDAFSRLSPTLSQWRLGIVGRGELKQALQTQAARLRISERVDWHGHVPDPFFYYRSAQIFVLSSRYEGMPNALLEAMSCGLPVIVSNASPGPLELVKNGDTGLVVPVNDPEALSRAIEVLAGDEELRRRLGDAGRRCVARYDVPHALEVWEKILGWRTEEPAPRQNLDRGV